MPNKAAILLKLTVDKDLRTNEREEIKTGRIAYFFDVVKLKFNEMVKIEMFFLLFAIPLILLITYFNVLWVSKALSGFQFTNYMGIGYTASVNSPAEGVIATYKVYRLILLLLIPAITLCGVGASGMFYCSRGLMWKEPVVVHKAFFRGIKKLAKNFVPVFFVLGLIACGIGYAVLYNLEQIQMGQADFLSYFLMIISIIFGVLTVMVLIFLLPMFACYKFKFIDYLKNSVLLNTLVTPVSFIMAVISIAPFLLMRSTGSFTIVLYFIIFGIGFIFIAMMWTGFAQNIFETMIMGMYNARQESERKKAEKLIKKPEKAEFVNPKKKGKQKK